MPPSPSSPEEAAHSPLSPSASKRWLACTASVGFIEEHRSELPPDNGGSSFANEGTVAHAFGARLLSGEKKVIRPPSSEMVACIEEGYVPFVRNEAKRVGLTKFQVELEVPLFYDRSQKGTCDAPLLGDAMIIIVDLKYGVGISVEAKNNTQLAIYGESAIREREKKRGPYPSKTPCELVIYQPRAPDNRFVRRWALTRGELATFCSHIQETAHRIIMDPDDVEFHADAETTCRFCPAKAFCSHYAAHLLEETPPVVERQLSTVEARVGLPSPASLSDQHLIRLLRVRGDLDDWFDKIEEHVVHKMVKGKKYEGLKLVEGKTRRKWKDEKAASALLQEVFDKHELFSQEFLSPAKVGDLIKELPKKPSPRFLDRVAKLIDKPDGQPKIAPREDPRPPMEVGVLDDFESLL